MRLTTFEYTAYIKACSGTSLLVDKGQAAFKQMIWGPRRLKPNQVTYITLMKNLREIGRLHEALDVYCGMRRAGQLLLYSLCLSWVSDHVLVACHLCWMHTDAQGSDCPGCLTMSSWHDICAGCIPMQKVVGVQA